MGEASAYSWAPALSVLDFFLDSRGILFVTLAKASNRLHLNDLRRALTTGVVALSGVYISFCNCLQPSKKTYKKIKDTLDSCYQHLDNQGFSSTMYDTQVWNNLLFS